MDEDFYYYYYYSDEKEVTLKERRGERERAIQETYIKKTGQTSQLVVVETDTG